MQKALLIKLEAPSYSSIGMENAFKEHFEVRSIDWQKERFFNGLDGLWNKVLNECITFAPDIIFCQLQIMGIFTIEQWKRLAESSFVINFTEDVRDNISWYEEVIPLIGHTIFTNCNDVRYLYGKGVQNVSFMPVPYNDVWYKPQEKTDKYYGDIVFVGNNYVNTNLNFPNTVQRQEMLRFMKENFGDKFHSYGVGQEHQMLSPMQCVEAYNNAKIVIAHNNFTRDGYCSDRGMNAMGCGAVVVHQYFEGIESVLAGKPYVGAWKTFEGLKVLTEHYLSFDTGKLKVKIADYARYNHTWRQRIKLIIKIFEIEAAKKATVLFTTEDGVAITDEEKKFCGVLADYNWPTAEFNFTMIKDSSKWKFFSTEEARDKYILKNKTKI